MPPTRRRGAARLALDRACILAHRRRANGLVERRSFGPEALRTAASAGLTDSMPRAALLSLHARVDDVAPDVLDDPALAQVWGPRFSVYVVASDDVAPFTLGRLPTDERGLARALAIAARLTELLDGRSPLPMSEAGHALGIHPNALRYASPTGTVRIRWDGARQPTVEVVPAPEVDPGIARRELARRHLHALGPSTPASFSGWAGVKPRAAAAIFDDLADELLPVGTPIGDGWILADDETSFRAKPSPGEGVRLLPSGDAYWLLWDDDRRLLVPDDDRREQLWTSRVWPGAVLVDDEVVGTWRRAKSIATVSPWRRLTTEQRAAIESEAASMPLPDLSSPVRVAWDD